MSIRYYKIEYVTHSFDRAFYFERAFSAADAATQHELRFKKSENRTYLVSPADPREVDGYERSTVRLGRCSECRGFNINLNASDEKSNEPLFNHAPTCSRATDMAKVGSFELSIPVRIEHDSDGRMRVRITLDIRNLAHLWRSIEGL